jgi:hypothetical protein
MESKKLKTWAKELPNGDVAFVARPVGTDGKLLVFGTPQGGIYVGLAASQIYDNDDGMICVPQWLALKTKQFWE